jgi:hypothetical protein
MVFLSYAHEDSSRVEPLAEALGARFNLWWDRDLDLGESWRQTLMDKLDSARCVVVVWTTTSVGRDFVWSEIERVQDRGVVVPVKLDRNARIPLGFTEMQHLDLSSWTGRPSRTLDELCARIARLLAKPAVVRRETMTSAAGAWRLRRSIDATTKLERLTDDIATLGGVLIAGNGPVDDLLGTLDEVHRTYASVSEAVTRFIAPAVRRGPIDAKPYLAMERGQLATLIANNQGHCTRIVEYYFRVGGLRDWLSRRVPAGKLASLDKVFGELGEADDELFAALFEVGHVLTAEASAIVNLVLAGQQRLARRRILEGREKLLPLEGGLSKAMGSLQRAEATLGFVPGTRGLRRAPRG